MLYDLSNPLQAEQFKSRSALLVKNGKIVELTEKKPIRTDRQNRYLHVILGYFASEMGNTLEYVKQFITIVSLYSLFLFAVSLLIISKVH